MRKRISRPFQYIMKIAMNIVPWRMPETLEGEGSIKRLPSFIKEKGNHTALIVTDKTLMNLGLLSDLFTMMDELGMDYTVFDEVEPNPTDSSVEYGVALYKENSCDCIIAFGGGSPMDCAKGIAARLARPNKSIKQLQGLLRVVHRVPNIYAVPTTAGTGSETTIAAVITCATNHQKASINDISIMPRYAVLDPLLTVGLPPHITATTGMDALSHAVEAYTNNTYNTKLERDLCRKAVKLIYENLEIVYQDGSNLEARYNMQLAAFYAGRAFSRGSVGYVHAIGHALGGLYGTPHGLVMSILLPKVMKEYGSAAQQRLAELYEASGMQGEAVTVTEKANAFIAWMESLNARMNIPASIPQLEKDGIAEIVDRAYREANPLYPTPVTWSKDDFTAFLYKLYREKENSEK